MGPRTSVSSKARHGSASLLRRKVDQDRLVLVISAKEEVPPSGTSEGLDLRAFAWVVREAGSGTRAVLEDLARERGLTLEDLQVVQVLPGNEAVREAVEAGAGATVISEHVVGAALAADRLARRAH